MKLRYYEDYVPGAEYVTAARVVTASDVERFADLTGDHHRLHLDEEFGRASLFGERIAHGLLGLSFVVGLAFADVVDSDYVLAFLGLQWRFTGPIRIGDAVHATIRIADCRPTKHPERGVVVWAITLQNEHGVTVQTGEFSFLIARRSAAPATDT